MNRNDASYLGGATTTRLWLQPWQVRNSMGINNEAASSMTPIAEDDETRSEYSFIYINEAASAKSMLYPSSTLPNTFDFKIQDVWGCEHRFLCEVRDDELIVKNGSVVVENENGHVEEITGEEVVKSIVQVVDANGIADVEMKTDDVEYEVIVDLKSTLNATESSQVNGFMLCEELNGKLLNQVKVAADAVATKDDLPTSPDPVENTDSQAIVNNDLSPVDEEQGQVTVDESVKPFKDLESQVTANMSDPWENPIKEDESEVSVDVSESTVGESYKNHKS
nr:CBS domain-containing protein CBSCBSPB1-like [Tanacetum cinerariifolium]